MAISETLEKFEVRNRFTNAVQFTAEISVTPDMTYSVKLGLAVKWAVKARANLADAYLARAYLAGANLARAYLADAYLADAKSAEFAVAQTRILPEGDLIGWKKCLRGVIVKLRIPEAAKRSHAFGRKCRAEYADVIEVIGGEVGVSQYDGSTEYRAGQRVTPDRFDENWQEECSSGIHFFITRLEAENY